MVGSLDLARLPLGIAQREAWRGTRPGFASESLFSQQLLALKLQTVPLPLPQLTTVVFFSLWTEKADLQRFRETSLRRWRQAEERMNLTLCPVQSFGSWRGRDPLSGHRSEAGSGPVLLVTHSRTRPSSMRRFLFADRPVVQSLKQREGHIWANGFVDRLQSGDSGTLSLWRSTADALSFAYGPGVHQRAVAAQRDGGWFSESWFARFEITGAEGRWRDLDVGALSRSANPGIGSAGGGGGRDTSISAILARHGEQRLDLEEFKRQFGSLPSVEEG